MIQYRLLINSDLPEILEVQQSAYHETLLEPSDTFAQKMALFPQGAIGAFDESVLSAYVFCHPWTLDDIVPLRTNALEIPERPTCMYIHDLAVEPESRGRGLAARLVGEVLGLTRSARLPAVALVAVQGSEMFWERFGFAARRELEYKDGITAHYMVNNKL